MIGTGMKKMALGAALFCCTTAFAHPPITVYVNGTALSFDQPPIIREERTLVPMRAIFQALGASVSWDEPTQTVTAVSGTDVILFRVGEKGLYKNDALVYTMPVPAQIMNDRLLVPLRAVAESMGASVGWDGVDYVVEITSVGNEIIPPQTTTAATQTEPLAGGYFAEVKAEDGTVVLTAKLECDLMKSGRGAVAIDQALAEETFALGQAFVREHSAAALAAYAAQGDAFLPYHYIAAYDCTRQQDGYASFLVSATIFDGKEERRSYHSATYDLETGKAKALSELVTDSNADLEALWLASFRAILEEKPDAFYADAEKRLEQNLEQVQFYLTEDGIVFYLSPGVLAPQEAGIVSFAVEYEF